MGQKDHDNEDQTNLQNDPKRFIYPPKIEETNEKTNFKFEYDGNKDSDTPKVTPPSFDKNKFENIFLGKEESIGEPISKAPVEIEKEEAGVFNVVKRDIVEKSDKIHSLKTIRKTELESYLDNSNSLEQLENKKDEIEEVLKYENSKNKNIRNKLIHVKEDINSYSVNIEQIQSKLINKRMENDSITGELERLEKTKADLETTIAELVSENGALSDQVAMNHRDKNDVLVVIRANEDIIADYKKQTVVNKENINSIRSDIDFKNKQINAQVQEIEFAKDELASLKKLEASINEDLIKSQLELETENKEFLNISEDIQNLKLEISNIETQSVAVSDKRKVLATEFHKSESKYSDLIETKKAIEAELESKREIISKYDSQISQLQIKNDQLFLDNTNILKVNNTRKQEVSKLQKIFEIRTNKIQRLESEIFEYEKKNGVLLSDLEEHKIQNTVLERRLNSLKYDYKSFENEVKINSTELENSLSQNQKIESEIETTSNSRDHIVEKISTIKKQIHKANIKLEENNYELSRLDKDSQKQSSSYSALKVKRDDLQETLDKVKNELASKNFELKQLIGDRRHIQAQIGDLLSTEANASKMYKEKSDILSKIKSEKIHLLDEKLALEEKVNLLTFDVCELDGHLSTEAEIVEQVKFEKEGIEEKINDLGKRQSELSSAISNFKNKKIELSSACEKSYIEKSKIESNILRIDREKTQIENELISVQEDFGHIDHQYQNVQKELQTKSAVVEELKEQKLKIQDQLETRKTIIEKKKKEISVLNREERTISNELQGLKDSFGGANNQMISSTMGVKHSREEVKRKREELKVAKEKYLSLTSSSKGLQEDHGQQMLLIKELDQTKSRYLSLIEELSIKNTNIKTKLNEGNQFIETLQKEVETLKENVHLLSNYRKKKAA